VIFDLDGTLVDTSGTVGLILNSLRLSAGLSEKPVDSFKHLMSVGGLDMVSDALEVSGEECHGLLKRFREMYLDITTAEQDLYPGVRELLEYEAGLNSQLIVCTNKPRVLAEKVLSESGIRGYFSAMYAGDDSPYRKPDPRVLDDALYGNVLKDARYVGDSVIDQLLAISLKLDFYFHKAGYDDGVDLTKCQAAFETYDELVRSPLYLQ